MLDPSGVAAEMRANFEEKTETSPSAPPRSRRGIGAIPQHETPSPGVRPPSPHRGEANKTKRGAFPILLLPAGERPRVRGPRGGVGREVSENSCGRSLATQILADYRRRTRGLKVLDDGVRMRHAAQSTLIASHALDEDNSSNDPGTDAIRRRGFRLTGELLTQRI